MITAELTYDEKADLWRDKHWIKYTRHICPCGVEFIGKKNQKYHSHKCYLSFDNPMKTEANRQRMSERMKGFVHSEEAKRKISITKTKPKLPSTLCLCGCGEYAQAGKRYIKWHFKGGNKGIPRPSVRGDNNAMRRPDVKVKHQLRVLESRTPEVAAKTKATLMERYGVENYSQTAAFKNVFRLENHPNWKGGITAEREAHYSRAVWKDIVKAVWKRDAAICQRCDAHQSDKDGTFHIHHIIGFEEVKTRDSLDNLVLLCRDCHSFVHSKKNDGEYRVAIQTP